MARDMKKTIKQGRTMMKKSVGLDLSVSEAKALCEQIIEGKFAVGVMWTTLQDAFLLGLATGYNKAKRDAAKAKKTAKKED